MKIILSRKGFDSSAGGCPNPIFPNGAMFALPIPDGQSIIPYNHVQYQDVDTQSINVGSLVKHLTKDKIKPHHKAHLDPDLNSLTYPRQEHWQPVLGQSGSAQGHLNNHDIGVGDVFVYFAVFREVEKFQRKWRFIPGTTNKHIIWATMKVADVVKVDDIRHQTAFDWLKYHPHYQYDADPNNILYLGEKKETRVFSKYHSSLQLTCPHSNKPSVWSLPKWFYPKQPRGQKQIKTPLSYHNNLDRWSLNNGQCELQAVARGQEFILNADEYPDAITWLEDLNSMVK